MARDLTSPASLYAKAILFLLLGTLASALLLLDHFSLRNLALLLLAIWAFCRAYYFVFYVNYCPWFPLPTRETLAWEIPMP